MDKQQYEKALTSIRNGQPYDGFVILAGLYGGAVSSEQESLMAMMLEVFYAPNQNALCDNYERNRILFREYPYWFGPVMPEFDGLPVLVFPVDNNRCFLFDKAKGTFSEIETNSDRETKYFFKDLSKPLFVENETNEYNLRFLADNVRASEDVAMDNHIYLYYKDPDVLFGLMQVLDLSEVIRSKKFVYLLESQSKKLYPINFKQKFGINYKAMSPQLLNIHEIRRLTINHPYGYSGSQFLCEIINAHPDMIVFYCWFFHEGMDKRGIYDQYLEFIDDAENRIGLDDLLQKAGNELCTFVTHDYDKFVAIIKEIAHSLGDRDMTALEWLKVVAVAKYYTDNGFSYISRITPIIYFDAHYRGSEKYTKLYQCMPYRNVLAAIRDPIVRYARSVKTTARNMDGVLHGIRVLHIAQNPYPCIDDSHFFVIKFEDMKLHPREAAQALCETLNIPMNKEMLHPERYALSCSFTNELGEALKGFDQRSMNRNIDDVVSDLDRLRYMLYLKPVSHLHGYSYDLHYEPETEEELRLLFSLPYTVEKLFRFPNSELRLDFRKKYAEQMLNDYFEAKQGKRFFAPRLISLKSET